jgi:dTDP-4-dehydrorhamnose 3,5-epimerase
MKFERTAIAGVWRISLEPHADERGYFARSFCADEFQSHGLPATFEQSSLSHNAKAGTLRGMHFLPGPDGERKVVRCVRGAVLDVAIDVRPGSPTQGQWISETLSADNGTALYIDEGIAHGFQTLEGDTTVLYQITPPFRAGRGVGVRWNDPAFAVRWPLPEPLLSDRDASYPDWRA